jgi:hypothetical protein
MVISTVLSTFLPEVDANKLPTNQELKIRVQDTPRDKWESLFTIDNGYYLQLSHCFTPVTDVTKHLIEIWKYEYPWDTKIKGPLVHSEELSNNQRGIL